MLLSLQAQKMTENIEVDSCFYQLFFLPKTEQGFCQGL